MIEVTMSMACFHKQRDRIKPGAGYKYNPDREALEKATGICLGRCNWEGSQKLVMTADEFVDLWVVSQGAGLSALRGAVVSADVRRLAPDTDVMYSRGTRK